MRFAYLTLGFECTLAASSVAGRTTFMVSSSLVSVVLGLAGSTVASEEAQGEAFEDQRLPMFNNSARNPK